LAAYFATGSRLISWIVVTAIVFRRWGADYLAILALVRTTVGLLNYTTLGLSPAVVRLLATESNDQRKPSVVFSSAVALAALLAVAGAILSGVYSAAFRIIHTIPISLVHLSFASFALTMGLGTVLRLASDSCGAALQVQKRISTDNILLAGAELLWMILCLPADSLAGLGWAWLASGAALALMRCALAIASMGRGGFSLAAISASAMRALVAFGFLVTLAQTADFLYAPTDNILINKLINPTTVAVYAPAIQIDAGLLLLVSGLATVILPRSAVAHGGGDMRTVRRYYIVGTLISLALLLPAAACVWFWSESIFRLWLHNPMTATAAILPLILIHTVVGGSAGVGRSILLGMGKVKAYAAAALIAGVCNVILSATFVSVFHLGLRGIIYGTIVAVVGRCAVWMPWYVWKVLTADR